MCSQSDKLMQKCAADDGAASNCQTGKNIGSAGELILLLVLLVVHRPRPMTELCYSGSGDGGVNISRRKSGV